jgi:hypothetical protein
MSESARRIAELQRELAGNPASRQFYQLGELLRRDGKGAEAAEAVGLRGSISRLHHDDKCAIMMLEVTRMVRTQIQLTDAEARALRRLAAEDSVSMSALVREAVDRLLAGRQGAPQAEVRRRAARAAGRFRSKQVDLSERHDEYAAGGFAR